MKYICSLCFLFLLASCHDSKRNEVAQLLDSWLGKEIKYPEDIHFSIRSKDTIRSMETTDYTLISYVDSSGCTSCKLRLAEWKNYIKELESTKRKSLSVFFIFHPKDKKEIKDIINMYRFDYPSFIDENDSFNKINHLSDNMMYQTFLVDRDNKIIAIGNPIYNKDIARLYQKIVSDNENTPLRKRTLTSLFIQKENSDFGVFDWKVAQRRSFLLKNVGEDLLFIDDVSTSCGCTSVEYNKEPVAPGKSVEIKITYKADHPEHFEKTISVYCNIPSSPLKLKIMGNAK